MIFDWSNFFQDRKIDTGRRILKIYKHKNQVLIKSIESTICYFNNAISNKTIPVTVEQYMPERSY